VHLGALSAGALQECRRCAGQGVRMGLSAPTALHAKPEQRVHDLIRRGQAEDVFRTDISADLLAGVLHHIRHGDGRRGRAARSRGCARFCGRDGLGRLRGPDRVVSPAMMVAPSNYLVASSNHLVVWSNHAKRGDGRRAGGLDAVRPQLRPPSARPHAMRAAAAGLGGACHGGNRP
jgi:hypothetical protein